MKKALKYIGLTIIIALAAGLTIFYFFPEKIIDTTNWTYSQEAKLEKNSIVIDNYTVNYYQSKTWDKKQTLVLLHGMGDDKSSFLQSAIELSQKYNLILPDLNGHGENAKDKDRNYSIKGQTIFLNQFFKALKINNFYLGGNSMGGHTALAYTLNYPAEVKSLILINAPGVTLDDHIVYGGFGKPMKTVEDLNKVLDRVFYKAPELPAPIANYMIETINNNLDFVDHVLVPSIVKGADFDLKNSIHNIGVPTLILWGKHDSVVKANVPIYLHKNIKNSNLVYIENASHSPQLEQPKVVAEAIISFLNEVK